MTSFCRGTRAGKILLTLTLTICLLAWAGGAQAALPEPGSVNQDDYFTGMFNRSNPLTHFDFGIEGFYYRYAEPNFMKMKGLDNFGISIGYTYRTNANDHVRSLQDIFTDNNKINVYIIEFDARYGEPDYESEGTGKLDDDVFWSVELRGRAGYDIPIGDSQMLTPYAGLGWRYLNNDSGGRTTTTGHAGYERESHYFYLPVGLTWTYDKKESPCFIEATAEFDVFLAGKQKSHLGDAVAGLSTVENDQESGWGARGSLTFGWRTDVVDFLITPFYRYWKIDDSDIAPITYSGILVGYGLEPENNTQEYGVRFGLRY